MGWRWVIGLATVAIGCTPGTEDIGVVDGSSDAANDDAAASSSTAAVDEASVGDDDATTSPDGGTTMPAETTNASDTEADTEADTEGAACVDQAWPQCPVADCVESWDYACEACSEETVPGPLCFGAAEGCEYPQLDCDLPMPCDRVWGQGFDAIEALEDDASAICLLESLRDHVPGSYELLWGEMGDPPHVQMEILVGADGATLMQWYLQCEGCFGFGSVGRSGVLELQPASYFDDCLAAPTTESLVQCVFGFTAFVAEAPPPAGYTPPFTTGTCTSLEIACPTG